MSRMTTVEVFAPAKINLTLHVTGQRDDGYHLIDSVVAFSGLGDRLTISESDTPSFSVTGAFAQAVPHGDDNLVLKAVRLVGHDRPGSITLEKRLPPSSGIGGGSADAAAAFRGMLALSMQRESKWCRPEEYTVEALDPHAEGLLSLGADVPMCLFSRPTRVRGIGEKVEFLDGLPSLPAVLVNPLRGMSTPKVFAALAEKHNQPMPEVVPVFSGVDEFTGWLADQRNDLLAPATEILPEINKIIKALSRCEGASLARMSGSGATCFGIFRDKDCAWRAADLLARDHPGWWIKSAIIGGQGTSAMPVLV